VSRGIRPPAWLIASLSAAALAGAQGCRGSSAAGALPAAGSSPTATGLAETEIADGRAGGSSPTSDPAPPALFPEGIAAARLGPAEDVFLLTGDMRAVRSHPLGTPRSDAWQVQIKWLAEDGSLVHAAEKVIEFDNTSITQGIEEKRLRLIQSEIDITSRKAALEAEGEEKRYGYDSAKAAVEKARIEAEVPPSLRELRDWQEKQADLKRAEAAEQKARMEVQAFEVASRSDLAVLEIARDKASRELEAAERDLEAMTIAAPRDGIFVVGDNWREERQFQIGDTSWPGLTVATIPDLTEMEVLAYLPEVDEGRIAPGMTARCTLDTYPDTVFSGKIAEVAAVADEAGFRTKGGFRVRITLEKSDPDLMRPGMSVRAEILRRSWDRALAIPRQAVRRDGDRTFVERADGGGTVDVRIAACTATECVVESGLAEGDRVVVR
jgi:HlyD family secretion protein